MGWVVLQILRPEACEFKVSLGVQGQPDLWIKACACKGGFDFWSKGALLASLSDGQGSVVIEQTGSLHPSPSSLYELLYVLMRVSF